MRGILVQLGEDVTYTHGTGSPVTVRGMFLAPYEQIFGVAGSGPRFAAMTEDVPTLVSGDTLARGAISYRIKNPQPDDPGGIIVMELEKQ